MVRYAIFILLLAFTPLFSGEKISSNSKLQQHILRGWNTWHNSSVVSHVLMPDGLSLTINFRNKKGGPYWLDDCYIANLNRNFDETVTPFYHAYDGSYTELELEWVGQKARIQTATDGDDIVILYTPIESPERAHILILEAGMRWNKPGTIRKYGEVIHADCKERTVKIAATKKPTGIDLPLTTPFLTFESNQQVGFYTGESRTVEEIINIFARQKKAHAKRIANYDELSEAYEAMQTMLAWNTIYDWQNDRALTPVSRVWNDAWGGYIIFDWDTYFTSAMLAVDNKELAYSNAVAMTDAITKDGFIPNLEATFGVKTYDRSQPPVGSMMVKMIYDKYEEKWFLEETYEKLLRWNRWWERARDNRGYLSWGTKPHPKQIDPPDKQAAKFESGLDNSPLFDDAEFNENTFLLELGSVGLMSLYIADCHALADMARELGKIDDVEEIETRAEKYGKKLQTMWDEETGIFRDVYLPSGEFSQHLAPTQFYSLISKVPTQEQAERMINEHFFDPDEFYGTFIMPSISRDDPGYKDNSYWRGRIWAPMNFLVYLGIRNYDLPKARQALVEKSLNLMMKEWRENRRVYENYNAETGVGGDVRNANSFYSWGALLGMMALMEYGYWK